ncbi:hypothetical protein [Xylanimonas ulmi]|uniref:Uncharacterized protein n=1 Tax=Xylanimonas ulmi TaxID=228973 RepID=A0A4Q7M5B8_9MICO|nr:hypothetical protein [Xylanibacterium ulmi]RZS62233.1 hypothetical protein EV386_2557 [Xylanibacterium ulmi]
MNLDVVTKAARTALVVCGGLWLVGLGAGGTVIERLAAYLFIFVGTPAALILIGRVPVHKAQPTDWHENVPRVIVLSTAAVVALLLAGRSVGGALGVVVVNFAGVALLVLAVVGFVAAAGWLAKTRTR